MFRKDLPAFSTLNMRPAKIIMKDGQEEIGYHCGGTRKTPLHKKKQASQLIEKLKVQGVVEDATPDRYLAPAHFVEKGDSGKLRLVTDYKGINPQTRRVPHGYPTMQELRDSIDPRPRGS